MKNTSKMHLKWTFGRKKLEIGGRKLDNGDWKLENGKWKLENGNWKLENGNRKLESDAGVPVSGPIVPNIRRLVWRCAGRPGGARAPIYPLRARRRPRRVERERLVFLHSNSSLNSFCTLLSEFLSEFFSELLGRSPFLELSSLNSSESHLFLKSPSWKSPFSEFSSTFVPPEVTFLEISGDSLHFSEIYVANYVGHMQVVFLMRLSAGCLYVSC